LKSKEVVDDEREKGEDGIDDDEKEKGEKCEHCYVYRIVIKETKGNYHALLYLPALL